MAIFNTPETRLAIRILAIAGFIILFILAGSFILVKVKAPHLLKFSSGIQEIRIEVHLDSLHAATFIQGMNGCENLVLPEAASGFYVSCLDGNIHFADKDESGVYRVMQSRKMGNQAIGLALDPQGNILAGVNRLTPEDWKVTGAAIELCTPGFDSCFKLTENYPSLNGIALDSEGNIYFASSNFNIFNPKGAIYVLRRLDSNAYAPPVEFCSNAGLANGLYYNFRENCLYFSNTVEGAYRLPLPAGQPEEVYLKLRFMEACDDLCTDAAGNVWMTDPGYSAVKMFNPGTNRLVRFIINGFGQASSCRIRTENGHEVIYISELKQKQDVRSNVFDGRGVLIVPVKSLLGRLNSMTPQTYKSI